MRKSFFICILFCFVIVINGPSQTLKQQFSSTYSYHPASEDKESWQRLNLWVSSLYVGSTVYGMGRDSSVIYASHSLGLSRLLLTAEGIDDQKLLEESIWFDHDNPGVGINKLTRATGKTRVELLLLLGGYYAFKPNSYWRFRDSVDFFLNKAVDESKAMNEKRLRRVALCMLGKMYVQGANRKGDEIFNSLIRECEIEGDKMMEAKVYFYRGLYTQFSDSVKKQFKIADLVQQKINYLNKAREIYQSLNDVESQIYILSYTGNVYLFLSKTDDAYRIFLKALELENSIAYPYTHYTTDALAAITMSDGKIGEPLKYTLQTVRTAEQARDSLLWGIFYDRLGTLYYTEGGEREKEGLKWLIKGLDRHVSTKSATTYQSLYNVVQIMNDIGGQEEEALAIAKRTSEKVPPLDSNSLFYQKMAFASAYKNLKQYRLAEQFLNSADSIVRQAQYITADIIDQKGHINTLAGSLYLAMGEFSRSKRHLEDYLADSLRESSVAGDMQVLEQLIIIDSVFHDASSASKHYKQYVMLLDSNFRIEKVRQADELQVIYQTKEKEDSIMVLSQQTKLEQANLKQATLVKNLTIGGIIAALTIAGLLYRQNRLRKKNNNIITHKNEQLQHLLMDKEWLLKEIHHRVKNNLQVVMSLLNSQSAYIDNDVALTAIHDSQHRVHAMSLIHQKLYNSENVSAIDMSFYIRELVSYLSDSFNTAQRIRFDLNIAPLEMDVSQAVPLGLILNEAITNSIKYAFPQDRNGLISISLFNTDSDNYVLNISDNGVGIHPDLKKTGSLGMSLMKGLSEDLDGKFYIENNNGTTVRISFVYDQSVKKSSTLAESYISNN